LTHLELVDTRISEVVLARIAHAHNIVSLTIHGTLDMPAAVTAIFGADHVPPSPDTGIQESAMRERIGVVVEHGADFVHIGKAIVIFGTESEAFEGNKFRHADCVKVPPTRN
jgi:hypothetical protein